MGAKYFACMNILVASPFLPLSFSSLPFATYILHKDNIFQRTADTDLQQFAFVAVCQSLDKGLSLWSNPGKNS